MSGLLRLKCPGCQVTIQVKSEMRGKEVSCPKCQRRIRLPEATQATSTPTVIARPMAPAPAEPSMWDDAGAFGSAPTQPTSFPQQYGSSPQFPPSHSYAPPVQAMNVQRRSSSDEPLTESESSLQSTAIFMIVIPILAAILPLFGLQLRRLARAGEYAPLGAMILGFIGAGLIVYARRKRRDAPIAGIGAVVVTLVFGVGGFLIQRNATPQEEQVAGNVSAQKLTAEQIAEHERMAKQMKEEAERRFAEAEKNHQEQMQRLNNSFGPPGSSGPTTMQPPNSFPTRPGTIPPNPSLNIPPPNNPSLNNPPPNNPSFPSSGFGMDALAQEPRVMGDLMPIYSSGKQQFVQLGFGNQNQLPTEGLVGNQSQFGSLFRQAPVTSLCGLSMAGELTLIPLSTKISGAKHAIEPGPQEEVLGLRFAFEGGEIVGYQGLVRSKESMLVTSTEWFGRQTDDVRESINPAPGQSGMVCYSDRGEFCGFAWVKR